ncbi:CGP-CTERM sorting domain-containing protein, partial [Thermococcus sp.]
FVTNFIHWALKEASKVEEKPTETTTEKPTTTETEKPTETGTPAPATTSKTCGPAALVGLTLIPLLLRKRK